MITILNEELYSFQCIKGTDPWTKKPSFKLAVSTSNKLVRFTNRKDFQSRSNQSNDIDTSKSPNLETTTREILSIITPSSDLDSYMNLPISLRVGENMRGSPTVQVRCLGEDDANKANIYVLAIPFNGMLKPIPEDPRYHIYKGIIGSSARPFFFNKRRYKKILYLVIEPHMALFNPEHKYHTTSIPVKVESYALYKDANAGMERTIHETYTFEVVSADGMYKETWENETLNEAITIPASTDTPIWVTFKFTKKDPPSSQSTARKPYSPKKGKGGQREGYVKGDTYVTTNRHGIRKEVPLCNRGGDRGERSHSQKDLDSMMKSSGMFDQKDDRRNNYRNKKGHGGKRGKGNRQYDDN